MTSAGTEAMYGVDPRSITLAGRLSNITSSPPDANSAAGPTAGGEAPGAVAALRMPMYRRAHSRSRETPGTFYH